MNRFILSPSGLLSGVNAASPCRSFSISKQSPRHLSLLMGHGCCNNTDSNGDSNASCTSLNSRFFLNRSNFTTLLLRRSECNRNHTQTLQSFQFSTSAPSLAHEKRDETSDHKPTGEPQKTGPPSTPIPQSKPTIIPGVALCGLTATAGFQLSSLVSAFLSIPLSGIPTSILLGMAIKNTILSPPSPPPPSSETLTKQATTNTPISIQTQQFIKTIQPGLTYSTKTILQCGIVAVAAKLSFIELLSAGSSGLPVILSAIRAGALYIPLAGKVAGLPLEMTLLLTVGTSICGVTAITALSPAIKAPPRDTAVAIANTVAFGTIGMLTYPYLFHVLCTSPEQVGACLGVSIHDTSQVLGSAMSYKETYGEEIALKSAAVTKLTRNLGLIFMIPGLSYVHALAKQKEEESGDASEKKDTLEVKETVSGLVSFQKYVPPFLVAFFAMSTIRSIGDYSLAAIATESASSSHLQFQQFMDYLGNDISKYALGTAMAGVGLSTSVDSLKGVGWRPFAVGGTGALVVGGTGFMMASMLI